MEVPFLQLLFSLAANRPAPTPYALFGLKQLFPAAFREVNGCALPGGECGGGADCPCRATFAQALSADPAALRRYQKPPLPFAFKIPQLISPEKGEYELSLTIVGDATGNLELYLRALQYLFSKNSAWGISVREISAVAADGSRQLLGSAGRLELTSIPFRSFVEAGSVPVSNGGAITVELLTPLRLLHNGRPLRSPSFAALAGALFRRVSALAYYYGGVELADDFKWLAQQSRAVGSSAAQLEWVNWGGALQGVVGELSFRGEVEDFLPFLRLGTLLNVGKGASYGMGSYLLRGD
jgi:hypothetical protein